MDTYTPFKDRTLNPALPVKVYRNLHKDCYSVKQDGVVVGHTQRINLRDCTFHVSAALRDKVRESKVKNVHALIQGYVTDNMDEFHFYRATPSRVKQVYYNPYLCDSFVINGGNDTIESAPLVAMTWNEVGCLPMVHALLEV